MSDPNEPSNPNPPTDLTESSEPDEPLRHDVSHDAVPRRGLATKIIAAVVVVALVAGAGFFIFSFVTAEPNRVISLGQTVAGMQRDDSTAGDDGDFEAVKDRQAKLVRDETDAAVEKVEVGAYTNTDTDRGPEGPTFVIAGELEGDLDASQLLGVFREQAESNEIPVKGISGGEDARAFCTTDATGDSAGVCAWATSTSFGQVVTVTPGWSVDQLGSLMRDVRADVETTE